MYQVWLKSLDIYLTYRPENKNSISDPKPDPYNINAYTLFGENLLMFTQVIIRKRKYGRVSGR